MRIKYLGTAAAEGIPALFCKCDVCTFATLNKGREIRTRSQALIDNKILIDFGPDSYFHMIQHDVPLTDISTLLITHSHSDHLYSNELAYRRKGYAAIVKEQPLTVYGYNSSYVKVKKEIDENRMEEQLQAINITPFVPFIVEGYEVIALHANHDINSSPVNYIINKDGKSILYAHDTGWFLDETMTYLAQLKKPLSLISLDCTASLLTNWRDHHLSFDVFLQLIEKLKEIKAIDDKTLIIANHFSHNGKATYKAMCEKASAFNVLVSYDGMEVEV